MGPKKRRSPKPERRVCGTCRNAKLTCTRCKARCCSHRMASWLRGKGLCEVCEAKRTGQAKPERTPPPAGGGLQSVRTALKLAERTLPGDVVAAALAEVEAVEKHVAADVTFATSISKERGMREVRKCKRRWVKRLGVEA